MSEILNLINDTIFASLVNTAWQMTLLIPLIALIIWLFRIRSSATRYSLWLFVVFAIVALPLITPFIPQMDFTRLYHHSASGDMPDDMMRSGIGGSVGELPEMSDSAPSVSAVKVKMSEEADVALVNPVSVAYFIWCAGAAFMFCITMMAYRKLRKLRLSSPNVRDPAVLEMLSRLKRKIRVKRSVALRMSPEIYTPVSLGIFSPTIILPDGVIENFLLHKGGQNGISELEMILTHELAHIRRHDYLINVIQNVMKVAFFFHPLFHLMNRSLTREREHICDDWVIDITDQRGGYAECIVGLLEKAVYKPINIPVTIAMAERKQDIPGRIDMIVDYTRKTATKVSRKALITMLLIGCLSLPVIGGIGLVRFAGARTASEGGRIVFAQELPLGVYVMDADGENRGQLIDDEFGIPSWSPTGRQIAVDCFNNEANGKDIYIMDADGKNKRNLTDMRGVREGEPSWSPDGKQIAFSVMNFVGENLQSGGIYVINTDGSNPRKLAEGQWQVYYPDWSPDGTKIVFFSTQDTHPDSIAGEIYAIDADGANMKRLTFDKRIIAGISWSPNGKKIAFASFDDELNGEIHVMDANGNNQMNITNTPSIHESHPCWSPDGTKIAFSSDRYGNLEICVMDADGSNVQQITRTSAHEMWPDWTAHSYAVEPAGKMKSTWGKIKRRLFSR